MTRRMLLFIAAACMLGGAAHAADLEFALKDLDGATHSLADYRGKWIVVNYWATWCPPCLDEIPDLVAFHEKHSSRDAVVLGVNFEDVSAGQLRAFVEDYFISYPVLRSEPTARVPFGRILGLPTTFLITPSGKLVAQQSGPLTAELIEGFMQRYTSRQSVDGR